jgi:glycosyltransferase involved in cell wall biosynthesis
MRIMMISRRFAPAPGGVEHQLSEIGTRFARKGHSVVVHTSDLYSDVPFRRLALQEIHQTYALEIHRHHAVPVPGRSAVGTSVTPTMLMALTAERRPHIVHAHGLNLVAVSAALFSLERRWRVVFTSHIDPDFLTNRRAVRLLSQFDGLVALTELEQKRMLDAGLDQSRIRYIPNGINVSAFAVLPERNAFRRKMKIKGHLLLYAGRLDSNKGLDFLIEATALAGRTIGSATIVFAGPDWGAQSELEKLAAREGVRALFVGNLGLSELKSAFVSCDAFVLPSLHESFPMSILEAMLCRTPIVATRTGGIPSLVQHEETGLLVSPRNSSELAAAICRIIDDRSLSESLVANARRLASQYSIERTIGQLEDFYKYVLSA